MGRGAVLSVSVPLGESQNKARVFEKYRDDAHNTNTVARSHTAPTMRIESADCRTDKRMVDAGTAVNYGRFNPYIVVPTLTLLPEQYFCNKINIITLPSLGELKMASRNIL